MYINVDVRIKFYNLKEYVFFMNIYLILKFIRYTESSIAFLAMVFLFEKKKMKLELKEDILLKLEKLL